MEAKDTVAGEDAANEDSSKLADEKNEEGAESDPHPNPEAVIATAPETTASNRLEESGLTDVAPSMNSDSAAVEKVDDGNYPPTASEMAPTDNKVYGDEDALPEGKPGTARFSPVVDDSDQKSPHGEPEAGSAETQPDLQDAGKPDSNLFANQTFSNATAKSLMRSLFADPEDDFVDVKREKIQNVRHALEQLAVYPMAEGLQRRWRLSPPTFVGLGLFAVFASITLFVTFFLLDGRCEVNIVLATSNPDGTCAPLLLHQTRTYTIDTAGRWEAEEDHNPNRAYYRLHLLEYTNTEEGFRDNLRQLQLGLNQRFSALPTRNFMGTLEQVYPMQESVKGVNGTMTLELSLDLGIMLHPRTSKQNGIYHFANSEANIADHPGACITDFDRYYWFNVKSNAIEDPVTIEWNMFVWSQNGRKLITPGNTFILEAGSNSCTAGQNDLPLLGVDRTVSGDSETALPFLRVVTYQTDYESFGIGFDAKQGLALTTCNASPEVCPLSGEGSRQEFASGSGYETAFLESIGKWGYKYETGSSNLFGESKRMFAVIELGSTPEYEFCRTCSEQETGDSSESADLCQRQIAVLLHLYQFTADDDATVDYRVSMYYTISSEGFWNSESTSGRLHCGLTEILFPTSEVPVEAIEVPYETSTGLFECELTACKSILERLGSAQAVSELFFIIMFVVLQLFYHLYILVRSLKFGSMKTYLETVVSDVVPEELKHFTKKKALQIIIGTFLLCLGVAIFLILFFVPVTCESSIVLKTEQDQGSTCSVVPLTEVGNHVMDQNGNWASSPSFDRSKAYYELTLQNYTVQNDVTFSDDLSTAAKELNAAMSTLSSSVSDSISKLEALLLLREQDGVSIESDHGTVILKPLVQSRSLFDFESQSNVAIQLITPGSDETDCSPRLSAVRNDFLSASLYRSSPLKVVTLLNPQVDFGIDDAAERAAELDQDRPAEEQCYVGHEAEWLTAAFRHIQNYKSVTDGDFRAILEMDMELLLLVDACNKNTFAVDCTEIVRRKYTNRIAFSEQPTSDGSTQLLFLLKWNDDPSDGTYAIPFFTQGCDSCENGNSGRCLLYKLRLLFFDNSDGTILNTLVVVDFSSQNNLNSLQAAFDNQCTLDDMYVTQSLENVEAPFVSDLGIFQCELVVCSSFLSRLASAFADTDLVYELAEFLIGIWFLIIGLRAGVALKPIVWTFPYRMTRMISHRRGVLLSIGMSVAFIAAFVSFSIIFSRCPAVSVVTPEFREGKCEETALRKDGYYELDSNGVWRTQDEFDRRKALFRMQFDDYWRPSQSFKQDFAELMKLAREEFAAMDGKTMVEVAELVMFSDIIVTGDRGSLRFGLNLDTSFLMRWTSIDPDGIVQQDFEYPLDAFFFYESSCAAADVNTLVLQAESCSLNESFRTFVDGASVMGNVKSVLHTLYGTYVENPETCANTADISTQFLNWRGVYTMNSVTPLLDSGRTIVGNDFDLAVSFDSRQTLALNYCNRHPANCRDFLLTNVTRVVDGLVPLYLVGSSEKFPSQYHEGSGLYGFLWNTGMNNIDSLNYEPRTAAKNFFVVPQLSHSSDCSDCSSDSSEVCNELWLFFHYYVIDTEGSNEELTCWSSYAKRINTFGLWNDDGATSSVHCSMRTVTNFFDSLVAERLIEEGSSPISLETGVFSCELSFCSPWYEIIGDAFALSKLLVIVTVLFMLVGVVSYELWLSYAFPETPKSGSVGDSQPLSRLVDEIRAEYEAEEEQKEQERTAEEEQKEEV